MEKNVKMMFVLFIMDHHLIYVINITIVYVKLMNKNKLTQTQNE